MNRPTDDEIERVTTWLTAQADTVRDEEKAREEAVRRRVRYQDMLDNIALGVGELLPGYVVRRFSNGQEDTDNYAGAFELYDKKAATYTYYEYEGRFSEESLLTVLLIDKRVFVDNLKNYRSSIISARCAGDKLQDSINRYLKEVE